MAKNKLIYQNWLVEIGYDPRLKSEFFEQFEQLSLEELFDSGFDILSSDQHNQPVGLKENIVKAVQSALEQLDDEEREFIIRFHFMGESYAEMIEQTNRKLYKLSALHKRALKKLKRHLKRFVLKQFNIKDDTPVVCPICNSDDLININRLLKERDKKSTLRPVIKELKEKYNIKINSPQIIIGHEKYH